MAQKLDAKACFENAMRTFAEIATELSIIQDKFNLGVEMLKACREPIPQQFEYFCKCGFHTPIETGMMGHLTTYRTIYHGFLRAEKKGVESG